jgi:hypothetical protein
LNWKLVLVVPVFCVAATSTAHAADVPLTEAQVRVEIIGKNVTHLDRYHRTYNPDGTAAGGDGRLGWMGTYRLEKDGRVCLKAQGDTMCFQYYRRNGQLRVRRTDSGSPGDIGLVTVEAMPKR